MNRPFWSSSLKCSQLAHWGTRLELASSTRGAFSCVLNTPTGLPDWISRDSSASSFFSDSRRSEEQTSELQSPCNLVCRLLLEKKKNTSNLLTQMLYSTYARYWD